MKVTAVRREYAPFCSRNSTRGLARCLAQQAIPVGMARDYASVQ
jgi:hypothetical protein